MKVGDLVKFQDSWKESLRVQHARMLARGFVPKEANNRTNKVALVVQDWATHDNFAVIFAGETEMVDFNDHYLYSDEIMEKVNESR